MINQKENNYLGLSAKICVLLNFLGLVPSTAAPQHGTTFLSSFTAALAFNP